MNDARKILIHPTYFPNVAHFTAISQHDTVLEKHDNYQKQTYRTRCHIYSPNGLQRLSVPIKHTGKPGHQKTKEVVIEDNFDWKKQHWKSLQTAYRTSPFFEFYEDDFAPFFEKKHRYLIDLNMESMALLSENMQLDMEVIFSENYEPEPDKYEDLRLLVNAKDRLMTPFEPYTQVFDEKYGFLSNLSSLDLLFNEGPNAASYLENQPLSFQ
ncbi:WbqC family protein [Robertkochia aurantiaca]|uniref:WbqC family protein n=1 Tax=Robertkochia aurantiaca TaxID=2873700 RepID=UPI001CCC4CE1|nr:WbqC family protein [Robertkochia sp. 3YJGBD-33]